MLANTRCKSFASFSAENHRVAHTLSLRAAKCLRVCVRMRFVDNLINYIFDLGICESLENVYQDMGLGN